MSPLLLGPNGRPASSSPPRRHAPVKQQLARRKQGASRDQIARAAEAKVKPGQTVSTAKPKTLADSRNVKRKRPRRRKISIKKSRRRECDRKAKLEIDLAKSEGLHWKNIKTAEANLKKARDEQMEAGKLPFGTKPDHEGKAAAAAWMQDWASHVLGRRFTGLHLSSTGDCRRGQARAEHVRRTTTFRPPVSICLRLPGNRLALAGGSPEMSVLAAESGWTLARSIGGGVAATRRSRIG
ncbi:MAG: hypothetical protein CM1200mP29_05670 [Verrucomicrobiota bacterium]|nr:MAG: hypothetical protein CM1200mP29_05670 [Verrucomicrobiota bacterium]